MQNKHPYLTLFLTFLKIGLFTFGGGYAMISLIEREFVTVRKWISAEEMMDMIAVSEATPGPLAINSATYVGYRLKGFGGALLSTVAVTIPSFVIIFCISLFLDQFLALQTVAHAFLGIQVAVGVLILIAGINMLRQIDKNALSLTIMIATLVAMILIDAFAWNFSVIWLILIGGALGLCVYGAAGLAARKRALAHPPAAATAETEGAADLGAEAGAADLSGGDRSVGKMSDAPETNGADTGLPAKRAAHDDPAVPANAADSETESDPAGAGESKADPAARDSADRHRPDATALRASSAKTGRDSEDDAEPRLAECACADFAPGGVKECGPEKKKAAKSGSIVSTDYADCEITDAKRGQTPDGGMRAYDADQGREAGETGQTSLDVPSCDAPAPAKKRQGGEAR